MIRSTLGATGLAAAASLALAAPAVAGPGTGTPSGACLASGDAVFPGDPGLTHGGCVSFRTTGELRGGAYAAQCRILTGGKYPFTFYGQFTVRNAGECLNVLRGFHTAPPQQP